ncbi:MAG: hypothetical protein ACKVJX_04355 [Verrucomicrobiia bacterium]
MAIPLIRAKVVMLTLRHKDKYMDGVVILSDAKIRLHEGQTYVQGLATTYSKKNYLHGKRITVPMDSVGTMTEFDSIDDIWKRKKGRAKISGKGK